MTNQLATLSNNLPAHIQGDGAQAAALVTSESVPRISLRDASFRLKKDGNEINVGLGKPIQVVILGIDPPGAKQTSKSWYEGAWSEDSADAPDCYSKDGVRPDPSIAEPQCSNCAQCPKNAWGSGHREDGSASAGKACSDRKNLLVVIGGKHIDGDVFRISVPPTSLKALSAYGRDLVRYNVNMNKVITEVSIDPDNAKGMLFNYAGFLEEPEANRMAARAASPEIQEMVHPQLAAPAQAGQTVMQAKPSLESQAPAAEAELDLGVFDTGDQDVQPDHVPNITEPAQAQVVVGNTSEVDNRPCPWDARVHSANKSKIANGNWRPKRGVPKETVAQIEAELMGSTTQTAQPTQEAEPAVKTQQVQSADELEDILSGWGDSV